MNVAFPLLVGWRSASSEKGFKMNMIKKIILGTIAAATMASPSFAASTTTTFTVKANVAGNCSFNINNIDFGTYVQNTEMTLAANVISVNCSTGTTYTITLNNGSNVSGVQRRMNNAGVYIPYQLYTDNTYSTIWNGTQIGTTQGVGQPTGTGTAGTGSATAHTIYAKTQAVTASRSGDYTDLITATINY